MRPVASFQITFQITFREGLAWGPGFEPGLPGPKPGVLPVRRPPTKKKARQVNAYRVVFPEGRPQPAFHTVEAGYNMVWPRKVYILPLRFLSTISLKAVAVKLAALDV